ncbi:MAG: hypothetical protein ACXW1F_04310, partial [Halobacteriota archaeon]
PLLPIAPTISRYVNPRDHNLMSHIKKDASSVLFCQSFKKRWVEKTRFCPTAIEKDDSDSVLDPPLYA